MAEGTQRPDGAWHTYYLADGTVEEPRLDTNVSAYVATGVWHHFLATGDAGFLEELWGVVERAVGFALAWQRRAESSSGPSTPTGRPATTGC